MDVEQTTAPLTGTPGEKGPNFVASGPPRWRSCRFLLAYMIMGGNIVLFLQRVSFSMAIVCMVNHTALDLGPPHTEQLSPPHTSFNHSTQGQEAGDVSAWVPEASTWPQSGHSPDRGGPAFGPNGSVVHEWKAVSTSHTGGVQGGPCDRHHINTTGSETDEDGPFVWSKEMQGLLLGAVYWGYMTTQILGGYLFLLFGPRLVTLVSMLTMAVLIMLCHPAALWSPWAVFALRVAVGICTSFAIPSMFAIWGKWAPKGERATLLSLSFSGQNVANSVVFPTSALLCKYGFAGGWPSVFYVFGAVGVVWCLTWAVLVSDSPEESRWILAEEKDYIVTHRGHVSEDQQKLMVPWCSIFTSMSFWAIVVGHVTFTWGLFLFMSNLPLYMYEVMNFDIKSNGFYSMLPYLALFFVQMTGGFFTDFIVRSQILTVFWARRMVTGLAYLVPAVSLLIMSYLDCTQVAAVMSLLVISVGFMGFAFSGFFVNAFDVAPRYAVSITSVTNSFACIPGIVTPYLVAEVTVDQTREQWQIIFFITGAVYLCGTLFFCLFAQTSVQSWALPQQETLAVEPPLDVDGSGPHHQENHSLPHLPKTACAQPEDCEQQVCTTDSLLPTPDSRATKEFGTV